MYAEVPYAAPDIVTVPGYFTSATTEYTDDNTIAEPLLPDVNLTQ